MSTQTAPSPYQPPNQAGAASAFQTGAGQIQQGGQQVTSTALPGYQALLSGAQNNPFYGSAQNTAGQVAGLGQTLGQSELSAGRQLQSLVPGVLATGFDPQSANYNRYATANMDQLNAINAANGVAGSPYGAGLAAQGASNFNLDWQQGEQARQLAAVQSAQGLYQSAASQGGTGLDTIQASGMLPNQTYEANQNNIASMLQALVSGDTSAFGLTQQGVQDQGTYLGIGQNATQIADSAAKINNDALAAEMTGFGKLFGDVLGFAGNFVGG